jgi:hypothetical protein
VRVSIFSADPSVVRWATGHLRQIGVDVFGCSSARELPFLAERSDVLLALTDDAELFALADALRCIERLSPRPALIVLGRGEIPWTPRPSTSLVIVAPLAFLEWPVPLPDESYPELPFTD